MLLAVSLLASLGFGCVYGSPAQRPFPLATVPVPVTLGVMSRCPDAVACEAVFDDVLKQIGHERVDLEMLYIGSLNSSEPTGATCKHGPLECIGNIQQLCVEKYTQESQNWWPFIQCQDNLGKDQIGYNSTALHCAKAIGIDWTRSGIEACVNGEEGKTLLTESLTKARELGITLSCTIRINHKHRCIRDSEWKQCEGGHEPEDFIRTIEEEWRKLNADQY